MPNAIVSQNVLLHHRNHLLILCLVLALFILPPAQAEEFRFPGLEALMTDEEFARTGLNELTPAQRSELNHWLSQRARFKLEETPALEKRTKTQTKKPRERLIAKRMSRAERTAVKPIRTRIVGKFKGWTGTTLFRLENGEYWKQRQGGRYYYKAESPEVELFKNRFGFWEIRILATGKTVKVSRYEP